MFLLLRSQRINHISQTTQRFINIFSLLQLLAGYTCFRYFLWPRKINKIQLGCFRTALFGIFLCHVYNKDRVAPRRPFVHSSKRNLSIHRSPVHGVSHFRDTGYVNLCAVLDKYTSLFVLFNFELVLRGVEQVHDLLVVDFDVGALHRELKALIESLNFLKEPFHHSGY